MTLLERFFFFSLIGPYLVIAGFILGINSSFNLCSVLLALIGGGILTFVSLFGGMIHYLKSHKPKKMIYIILILK